MSVVGRFTLVMTALAGLIAAPFLIDLLHNVFDDAPAWFAFLVLIVFSVVAMLAGEFTRGAAVGLILGTVAFGVLLAVAPDRVSFLRTEVPPPF